MERTIKIKRDEYDEWARTTFSLYASESYHADALRFWASPLGVFKVMLGRNVVLYEGKSFKAAVHAWETA